MSHLASIQKRVQDALLRSNRPADSCQLMVVSKTWPADRVAEIIDLGHRCFGENKVQEAEQKIPQLADTTTDDDPLDWHLIGHLQRNKVRKALPLFGTLHGVDSLKLAKHISNVATELELNPRLYLQVNIGDEINKNGYAVAQLRLEIQDLLGLPNVEIAGLMCIPPATESAEAARPWFVQLRELRDELETLTDQKLPGLSMGMSSDFEVAIEEGATIIRVGSAIFGQR